MVVRRVYIRPASQKKQQSVVRTCDGGVGRECRLRVGEKLSGCVCVRSQRACKSIGSAMLPATAASEAAVAPAAFFVSTASASLVSSGNSNTPSPSFGHKTWLTPRADMQPSLSLSNAESNNRALRCNNVTLSMQLDTRMHYQCTRLALFSGLLQQLWPPPPPLGCGHLRIESGACNTWLKRYNFAAGEQARRTCGGTAAGCGDVPALRCARRPQLRALLPTVEEVRGQAWRFSFWISALSSMCWMQHLRYCRCCSLCFWASLQQQRLRKLRPSLHAQLILRATASRSCAAASSQQL